MAGIDSTRGGRIYLIANIIVDDKMMNTPNKGVTHAIFLPRNWGLIVSKVAPWRMRCDVVERSKSDTGQDR
jgi:hypothetical protein